MSRTNTFKQALGATLLLAGCAGTAQPNASAKWTEFVQTPAHANPIPKAWVATPEGRFAHELKIPIPLPADAGHRNGMSSLDYYRHLCATEAGEFVFGTASAVESIFFARPPASPTDEDLRSRWNLEHPLIERRFQLVTEPIRRAARFVNPPFMNFVSYEEPEGGVAVNSYLRMTGYRQDVRDKLGELISRGTPMKIEHVSTLASRFGITWRGVRRPMDREEGIAGGEVIVFDIADNQVLYVYRDLSGLGGDDAQTRRVCKESGCRRQTSRGAGRQRCEHRGTSA